jgi:multiple sugar transport system substrate-binding protein
MKAISRRREILARVFGATSLLLVLAGGCRTGDSATRTVEFWALGSEGERVRPLLAEFERSHPQVRVRLQQIPWSAAHEKLLTAYVGGVLPDVFQVGTTWLAELHALGALAPLDGHLAAAPDTDLDDFFAQPLAAGRFDGKTCALPWYVDTRVLYYREDLLRAAGVSAVPEDWNQWLTLLAALRRQGSAGDAWGVLLPVTEWETIVSLAWQQDAQLLRDGGRFGDFRAPEFRAALTAYLSLFTSGFAVPPESSGLDLHADFARGRFAFFPSGPWTIGALGQRLPAALRDAWTTTPLPGRGAPGISVSGGASLAIHSESANAGDAWALLRFLVERDTMQRFHELSGDLPARRSGWTEAMRTQAPTRAFWEQLQHARTPPAIAEWERIAQAIARHTEAAVRGLVSVDEAVTRLDVEVDAILAKRRWLLERGAPAVREL